MELSPAFAPALPPTSGKTKDSHERQRSAITACARRAACQIELPPHGGAALSGPVPMDCGAGFAAMAEFLADHPQTRTILVARALRFARHPVLQLTGVDRLESRGLSRAERMPVECPQLADGSRIGGNKHP